MWYGIASIILFGHPSTDIVFLKTLLANLLQASYLKKELIFPGNTAQYESRKAFDLLVQSAVKAKWIAYAKRPFAGPEQVLEYLGRYTHRIAISNNRIQFIDNGKVVFKYRDRANDNELKTKTVSANEFIRRFLLHVLPKGFMKIRYFGFLSNKNKGEAIELIRRLIDPDMKWPEAEKETVIEMLCRLTGEDITLCPECKKGRMRTTQRLPEICNSS